MPRLAAQAEEQLKPAVGGLLSNAQLGTILNRDKLLAEAVPKAAPRAPAVSEPAPQAEWADRQYEQSLISATASAISSRVVAPSRGLQSTPLTGPESGSPPVCVPRPIRGLPSWISTISNTASP